MHKTFIVPKEKPRVNIPGNECRCGPPSDASECKENGWTQFTSAEQFSDQGECVDYVRHQARVVLPVPEAPQN